MISRTAVSSTRASSCSWVSAGYEDSNISYLGESTIEEKTKFPYNENVYISNSIENEWSIFHQVIQ